MRILVDCDGVITNFTKAFLAVYELNGGTVPRGFEWTEYNSHLRLPDQRTVERAWADSRLHSRSIMEPINGALRALSILNRHHHVLILTSPVEPWAIHLPARVKWFHRYCPWMNIRKQLIFCEEKWLVDGDILVDDNPMYLTDWIEGGNGDRYGVLINQPWNQDDDSEGRWSLDRCDSLLEFAGEEMEKSYELHS